MHCRIKFNLLNFNLKVMLNLSDFLWVFEFEIDVYIKVQLTPSSWKYLPIGNKIRSQGFNINSYKGKDVYSKYLQ